jgi:hypothetical protein
MPRDFSGAPKDAATCKETAAARRRQREQLAEAGEEMPSMEDIGLIIPGTRLQRRTDQGLGVAQDLAGKFYKISKHCISPLSCVP